jgi:hypothetical protein
LHLDGRDLVKEEEGRRNGRCGEMEERSEVNQTKKNGKDKGKSEEMPFIPFRCLFGISTIS